MFVIVIRRYFVVGVPLAGHTFIAHTLTLALSYFLLNLSNLAGGNILTFHL